MSCPDITHPLRKKIAPILQICSNLLTMKNLTWIGMLGLLLTIAGCGKQAATEKNGAANQPLKLGFIVKQPEEPWFQLEWKFADEAARKDGFELVKIGATDGEKVLGAIDNLAANGAKGFVICTPDTSLGPTIVAREKSQDLKVIAVGDQLLIADTNAMTGVC